MSTTLARQLESFNVHRGFDSHTQETLLHDAKTAGQFTPEDAFEIGLEGFEALCEMDPRFSRFRSMLFFGVPKEREQQTREEIESLEQPLCHFLRLLTDYFALPAATKALEHLVRNYRIHVYYVDECMACCLPYHSILEFQNFLSIMDLKETIWCWLEDLQRSKLPLPRELLVKRCISDQAILSYICKMAKWSAEEEFRNEKIYPFFAVLMCEILDQVDEVSEELMRHLVSTIASGLQSTEPIDYRKATYMVIIQLCTKASLSTKMISALLQSLLSSSRDADDLDIFTIISHIYQTQTHFKKAPKTFLKLLSGRKGRGKALKSLIQRGLNATRFLSTLIPKLIRQLSNSQSSSGELLSDLITHVPLADYVSGIISTVYHQTKLQVGVENSQMKDLVRMLDVQYPLLLDQAVDEILKQEVESDVKMLMLSLLHGTPHEGLHSPLTGSNTTLLAASDAPSVETRKAAMMELRNLMEKEQGEGMLDLIKDLLLRRLEDDDLEVACLVLECKVEQIYAPEFHLDVFLYLLSRCVKEIPQIKNPLPISSAVKIVDIITAAENHQQSSRNEQICLHLVNCLFPFCSEQISVSLKIGQCLARLKHPVASMISSHIDFESFEVGKDTETDLNKVLVEYLFQPDYQQSSFPQCLTYLMEKCGTRVSYFALLSLQHIIPKRNLGVNTVVVLESIVKRMETSAEILDEEVELTNGVVKSYWKTLLKTLKLLLETRDLPELDQSLVQSTLIQILKLKSLDKKGSCLLAALQCFANSQIVQYLLSFLNTPSLEQEKSLLVNGLLLTRDYLSKSLLEEEDLIDCVLPLLALLHHPIKSVREHGMEATLKLSENLQGAQNHLSKAMASLLQCCLHHRLAIEADQQTVVRLLTDLFSSYNEEIHQAKKLKTEIKGFVNSTDCCLLQQHFLQQLKNLHPSSHPTELFILLRSFRVILENHELLLFSNHILESLLDEVNVEKEGRKVELISTIVNLVTPEAIINSTEMKETFKNFLRFLEGGDCSWNPVRNSVLKQIRKYWLKNRLCMGSYSCQIFTSLLKTIHQNRDPENTQLASFLVEKWPLSAAELHPLLALAMDGEDQERELSLWTLEILQERKNFTEVEELVSILQGLLAAGLKRELDEKGIQICKAVFLSLENLLRSQKEAVADVALLTSYLQTSSDPSLPPSVLSLLQLMANKNPDHALSHLMLILETLGNQMSLQEEETGLQRLLEAVRVIVKAWMSAGQSALEVWKALVSPIGSISSTKRLLLCQAILQGTPEKAEGLSSALAVLLEAFSQQGDDQGELEWRSLAFQLCQMVNLTERNHALASLMTYSSTQTAQSVHQLTPRVILDLITALIKNSIPAHSVSFHSSYGLNKGLGFGKILAESLRQLSLLMRSKQELEGDACTELRAIKRALHHLTEALRQVMDISGYLMTLVELTNTPEMDSDLVLVFTLIRRTLNELEDMSSLSVDILQICPSLKLLLESKTINEDSSLQLALAVTQQLVQLLGSQYPDSFQDFIPIVCWYTKNTNLEIRGSALACMASFFQELGQSTLPHLPQFMPEILDSLQQSLKSAENPTIFFLETIESSLELLSAIIEGLGQFLSPYLDKILTSLLTLTIGEVKELRDSVLKLVPQRVPGRLLLPVLLPLTPTCPQPVLHLQLVKETVSMMDSKTVSFFLDDLLKCFYKVLDIRQSPEAAQGVEEAAIEAFLVFVMKLNEKQFKPVFDGLMDWTFKTPTVLIGRQITCFNLFGELAKKLKSLFVKYYPAFLDKGLQILNEDKKKQRKHRNEESYLLDVGILRCLYRGLVHDDEEVTFTAEVIKQLISIGVKQIHKRQPPNQSFEKLKDEMKVDESEMNFKGIEACRDDKFSVILVSLLIQIGLQSAFQKPLNHKVLRSCSKGSDYGRFLCLCLVRELVLQLKEEYSVLIPESIPVLLELLEVDDERVKKTCMEVIKLLEDLKGENNTSD